MIGPQRCGGVVAYDEHGNFKERFACEVHLFQPGPCGWQDAVVAERARKRENVESPLARASREVSEQQDAMTANVEP